MSVSPEQLGKAIVVAGLIPADELKSLWSALPAGGRPKDGETFAGLLVKQGKLTEFQSRELLSASSTPLVLGDYVLLSKIGAGGLGGLVLLLALGIWVFLPGQRRQQAGRRFVEQFKAPSSGDFVATFSRREKGYFGSRPVVLW